MPDFQVIPDKIARAKKPSGTGTIEPELLAPPPRPLVWAGTARTHTGITPEMEAFLVHGIAARAWTVRHETERDREGTDHWVQYCFEVDDRLIHGRWSAGYDDMHLAMGFPQFCGWMMTAFKVGHTFTVLYKKENPDEHRIFGIFELFVKQTLGSTLEKIYSCRDEKERDELQRVFLSLALAPSRWSRDEETFHRYIELMKAIGLYEGQAWRTFENNLNIVKRIFDSCGFDPKAIADLSEICAQYMPGTWAAT